MNLLPDITPISDLRHRQREILEKVAAEPVVLTHRGKGIAVLVSIERWNALVERLEALQDSVDAWEAREDAGPTVDFDEYVAKRGESVSDSTE